jgi:hypothetical protein
VKKRKTIHPEIEKYKLLLESKIIESEKKSEKTLENNTFTITNDMEVDILDQEQEQTQQALNSFLDQLLADSTYDNTFDTSVTPLKNYTF